MQAIPDPIRLIMAALKKDSRPGRTCRERSVLYESPDSILACSGGSHTLKQQWSSGIRAAVLDKAGRATNTGEVKIAAQLLSELR